MHKLLTLVLNENSKYIALAIDSFLGPCYGSLLDVVCDVISDGSAEEEEAIRWTFLRAQEGIDSSRAVVFAHLFRCVCVPMNMAKEQ